MNIGVTGHQNLKGKLLKEWIEIELKKALENRPEIQTARSCLAIGADQIFANIVLKMSIDLIGVIPSDQYENTFSHTKQKEYHKLLARCQRTEILNFDRPSEQAFFAASKHLVDRSHLLFAIWDGKQANGLGGTGDVVEYALSLGKSVIHLHSVTKTVNTLSNKDIIIK